MLKYFLHYSLPILFLQTYSCGIKFFDNKNLQNFLLNKIQYVNDELDVDVPEYRRKERDIHQTFEFHNHRVNYYSNFTSPLLLKLFDKNYVLDNYQLYETIPSEIDFDFRRVKGFTATDDKIKFIRNINYNNTEFILVCLENGMSNIYLATSVNNITSVQSIENPDIIKDSVFFTNNGKVYLITTRSSSDSSLASISLYEWLGTYFDKIIDSFTTRAVAVSTFPSQNSQIIIVLRNSTQPNEKSIVYEFNGNRLKKNQLLYIMNPHYMAKYIFNNSTYVIIFSEERATLYRWNDSEMIYIDDFSITGPVKHMYGSYIGSIPIVFIITQKGVFVYSTTIEGVNLLKHSAFEKRYQKIFDVQTIDYENTYFLYFFAKTNETKIELITMEFNLYRTETDSSVREKDPMISCLSNLKTKVETDQKLLDFTETEAERLSVLNKESENEKEQKVTFSSHRSSHIDFSTLENKYTEVYNALNEILPKVGNLFRNDTEELDGRVIVKGKFKATYLKARDVNLNTLNSVRWAPEEWLSYDAEQNLSGHIVAHHIITKDLLIPKKNVFEDTLYLNGNQTLYGHVKFNSMHSTDLYASSINDVPLDRLCFKTNPTVINGTKTFDNLKIEVLNIDYVNGNNASDIVKFFADSKSRKYKFNSTLNIKKLEVETINDVNWNTFHDSVFRIGKTNRITGNLIINNTKATNLEVRKINGTNTEHFLTTTTEQYIKSKINFGNIDSRSINCSNINRINFATDLVSLSDSNGEIAGPVTIDNMKTLKNMHINKTNTFGYRADETYKHGSLQIYKKVRIAGNLRVENLYFQPTAEMLLNERKFDMINATNRYWLKYTDQIVRDRVKILNGTKVPGLTTNALNGMEVNSYTLSNLRDKLVTNYHFENATIIGNVTLNDIAEHSPNFAKLDESSVKLTGNYEIHGLKTFNCELIVKNAAVDYLDDKDTSRATTVNSQHILGKKKIKNLIIKGNFSAKRGHIHHLNDAELRSIYHRILSIHRPVKLPTLKMKNITVRHLNAKKLNTENLNKYILNVDNLLAIEHLNRIKITGNTTVNGVVELKRLNNLSFHVIIEKISGEPVFLGNVKFTNNVHVKNFNAFFINDIDLQVLTSKLMYRYWGQNITAKHYFNIIRTPLLVVEYINNVNTRHMINVKNETTQVLSLRKRLIIESPVFFKSLSGGNMSFDIGEALKSIRNPPTRYWYLIRILKNATIGDEENVLKLILENALTLGKNNVISAPVTLSRISAKNLYTKRHVNNVNMQEIYDDTLLKHTNDEIVFGFKTFDKMTLAGATVYEDAKIPTVNKLLIERLDESIINRNRIFDVAIKGHKTFIGDLETSKLNTRKIYDTDPDNIVSVDNLKPIPHASFESLRVLYNFDASTINNQNFKQFLANRILKKFPTQQTLLGIFYFDNIIINGNTYISAINEIKLDDVVFDIRIQNIPSRKEFTEAVTIFGNISVNGINGITITETYEDSVSVEKETYVLGDLVFKDRSEISENISTKKLNGLSIEQVKAILSLQTSKIKVNIVRDVINKIENNIKKNVKIVESLPRDYMYLDKTEEFQIVLPKTSTVQALETKGRVIIHISAEESGYTCGLARGCNCPVQNTIQITPEHSLHLFENKGNQRVYSYEDKTVTAHVITDSISSSSQCTNLNSSSFDEYTTLTWINAASGHSSVFADKTMNGYITGVEFFSLDHYVYIIISRFYDVETRMHDLNCMVLRLDKRTNRVEIIQAIPTKGSSVMHLFYAAQGVHLIIGNKLVSDKLSDIANTMLYRFDREKQKFALLRQIYEIQCAAANSVVLGMDSFIVLAQKNAPLTLWKYNLVYENYYFHQSLGLDASVMSVSVLYAGDFGNSEAFVCAVTEYGHFHIYNFQYVEGWKTVSSGELEGLRLLTPFNLNKRTYLLASSTQNTSLLTLIEHGQN